MPVRVVHVSGGGLRLPSGIARALEYLVTASQRDARLPRHVLLDPRGPWPVPLGPWVVLAPFYLSVALVRAAWLLAAGRVEVMHLHVAGVGSTLRKLPFLLLARIFRQPVLVHLHSGKYERQYPTLAPGSRMLVRWFLGSADRVLALGPRMRDFVTRRAGVPESRVLTLPNAVAGPEHRRERPASRGDPRITFVGALLEDKGLHDLFDALSDQGVRSEAWQLTVVGQGDVGDWSSRAERSGIADRVRFTGWVSRAEVAAVLAETDLFVLPSRVEGMSLAVLEAMAHGCAIVATRVGETAEAFEDGAEGILTAPGDARGLAARLLRLLRSPQERDRLGRNARARYERCHTMERYVERLARIYRDLLDPLHELPQPSKDAVTDR